MSRRMALLEVMRALAVLALVCLNFAHAPLAAAPVDGWSDAGTLAFCGDPAGDDDAAHAPCHACRVGSGAVLPPSCPPIVPPLVVSTVDQPSADAPPVSSALIRLVARGPPAA